MSLERSFVMIKPDGIQRGIVGEIISRFERKGLKICAMKLLKIDGNLAERHYGEHKGKSFYKDLVDFITSSPVIATVLEGENAISIIRKLVGATRVLDAMPGTIRGDFAMHTTNNIVHASDSPESARREIDLFFEKEEILDYEKEIDNWL